MQQTPIPTGGERRRDRSEEGEARADVLADVNRRLSRELEQAKAQERALLKDLAGVVRDLEERDLLVREADHRIRNTLHLAGAMLRHQAMDSGNEAARDQLNAASDRLRAIAELQVGLPVAGEEKPIDELIGRVCRAMAMKPGVELEVRAPALYWPAATASLLGLFASEAVCNAMKHAFPAGEDGRLLVQLVSLPQEEWRLSISDNGAGAPASVGTGFGMRLLGLLARQLRGRLEVSAGLEGRGLCVSAVFPSP